MQFRFTDRVLKLKIRLAFATQQLSQAGYQSFAGYVGNYIVQLNNELDELKYASTSEDAEMHLEKSHKLLTEIQHVFLAGKLGIGEKVDAQTLTIINEMKTEVKDLIRRQQFIGNVQN